MSKKQIYERALEHFAHVVEQDTKEGKTLRGQLESLHPADLADFFMLLGQEQSRDLFRALDPEQRVALFKELSDVRRVHFLTFVSGEDAAYIVRNISPDELARCFDEMSDEQLKEHLQLLQKDNREKVLSVMHCPQDSVGRHMEPDVITLMDDFTVAQSVQVMQRLQPKYELHQIIFVTTATHHLVGYVTLEDLVLHKPQTKLVQLVKKSPVVAHADEDQERVAKKMMHYNVTTIPVVDQNRVFLGVISSDSLLEIIGEEARENIYRMATMSPMEHAYFDTPFAKLLYQRSSILILLLFAQSLSSMIISSYEATLAGFLTYFITMLVSTGGNTSSQTSAIVIQGLASGELKGSNFTKFIFREMSMAAVMSCLLACVTFLRVYVPYPYFWKSLTVSVSLGAVVMISVTLGSIIPLILRSLRIDPAHSAGPLLATLMDIVGLLTYCIISSAILG